MATTVVLPSAPRAWIDSRETQFAEHKVGSVNCAWQWHRCLSYRLSFSTTHKKRSFLPLATSSSSSSSFSPKTKLYVSGLSFRTTEESLRNAFQNFGHLVEVNLVMDRIANRPRGFAFLRYETEEESQKAIEGMHGKFLDGRVIFVEEAKPRSELRQTLKQNPRQY
ncbi:putative nucleotide-binding alpha-beta plait domain-containing protein [Rosa chinensis]|uniref:Putative nucleotide-binding alpha-beta plait domain-containing protein n=1 Tax=Rosa chinensis TaxID=74649 RepID=A0A2P6P1K3_ROSCH|nr:organelle RRM domain-containing protein 6, chloroplastic [Rosa chinensis]PRQ15811.1 putative nucleotide-binding alpha-beta plait domain-containing protein [Rosa chinensis]